MSREKKRVKVTYQSPNRLFEKWLEEWRDEAALKNTNLQYCYSKALRSLKRFPVPLKSGKECLILKNFGQGLCAKLDKKLAEYRKTHPNGDGDDAPSIAPSTASVKVKAPKKAEKPTKKRKLSEDESASTVSPARKGQEKLYVPAYRSGAYALLVTLYMRHKRPDYVGFMTKAELQKSAQPLCDASFYTPLPGSYYTAWSSMATLIKKAFVTKSGQPARFSLTDEGVALAMQLEEADIPEAENSASGMKQSSHSCEITTEETKVMRRKFPKKYSAISNMCLSEDEDDPDDPDIVPLPGSSPKNLLPSKSSLIHKTSHFLESRKTKNICSTHQKSPLAIEKYDLTNDTDDILSFVTSPPEKEREKLSFAPDSYDLSEIEDDPESVNNLPKTSFEKTESITCMEENSCLVSGKYFDRPVKKGSGNSNLSKKIASILAESSDSDDGGPIKMKALPSKQHFSKKVKQSSARTSHNLSETEDDSLPLSNSASGQLKILGKSASPDGGSCLSTENAGTISDLYFGNDDDCIMTQINLNPPESPDSHQTLTRITQLKENIPKFQDKQSQLSSQTSSSTCSTKSSTTKETWKQCSGSSSSSSQAADFHIFMPDTFDVILIVDNQETNSKKQKPFLLELDNNGTRYEVRHLKVGDYIWIARCKTTNAEVVLPYIIERKRMDDLGKSIKDGRFHEQKIRLKQSGMEKFIYLVETYGGFYGLPETTVHQAAINTFIVDNFQLKYTLDYKHSASYLSTLTRFICKQFKDRTIASCDKSSLPPFDVQSDFVSLMTFKDFSKGMSKTRNYTVKEMFIKNLLQLYGMSVEKATAITERYPTPKALLSAYKNGGGESMLASLTFGTLKRSVGPSLSKSVYQLYTSINFA